MPKRFSSRFTPFTRTLLIITFSFLILSFWLLSSVFSSYLSYASLESFELEKAQFHATLAQPAAITLSTLSLHQVPEIEFWRRGLEIIGVTSNQILDISDHLNTNNQLPITNYQITNIQSLISNLQRIQNQSLIFRNNDKLTHQLSTANNLLLITQHLTFNNQQLVAIFQNPHELRATGGFLGSFATLNFSIENRESKIENLTPNIYDIYDADGQFKGTVQAPPGVEEYLSEGEGLRLPDANWHPDFAMSSQQILWFLKESGFGEQDTLLAINSNFVKKLISQLGEIYVPDLGVTVTADNFDTLAGAHRENFFPGSTQKKQFLESVFTILKEKLIEDLQEHPLDYFKLVKQAFQSRDLQLYSTNEKVQKSIEAPNLSSQLSQTCDNSTAYCPMPIAYFVESNVGINKANKHITRSFNLKKNNNEVTLELHLFNNADPETEDLRENTYINYQRFIFSPELKLGQISIDGKEVKDFDQNRIVNSKTQAFEQIGFLLTLLPGEKKTVSIRLTIPNELGELVLKKQPGTAETSLQLELEGRVEMIEFRKDEIIVFE